MLYRHVGLDNFAIGPADDKSPSALSSLHCVSTTCHAQTGSHCLAGTPPTVISTAAFYSGHTPGLQHLNHVADQSTHRVATAKADQFPAAAHLPALAAGSTQRVTSLATLWRSAAVCPSLPGRHSFRLPSQNEGTDFRGPK